MTYDPKCKDVTVEAMARRMGIAPPKLLVNLTEAGIPVQSTKDIVSEEHKSQLLAHLREKHQHPSGQPVIQPADDLLSGVYHAEGYRDGRHVMSKIGHAADVRGRIDSFNENGYGPDDIEWRLASVCEVPGHSDSTYTQVRALLERYAQKHFKGLGLHLTPKAYQGKNRHEMFEPISDKDFRQVVDGFDYKKVRADPAFAPRPERPKYLSVNDEMMDIFDIGEPPERTYIGDGVYLSDVLK